MNTFGKLHKSVAAVLAASMLVAGCATPNGAPGNASADDSSECNPVIAAGVGAAIGVLVGDSARGAAIGAGLGAIACVIVNYSAEQVKSAQQVQDEYKRANKGRLPEQTTLVKYETQMNPGAIRPGQKAQSVSYIEIVQGKNDPNPRVEEEMTLYKPDGKLLKTVRKAVSGTSSAGAFKGGFTIPLPEGVPQGVYPVKTALYLNGMKVSNRESKLQVVTNQRGAVTQVALAN
jgi:energy-converting hydrogenase Eha subunit A